MTDDKKSHQALVDEIKVLTDEYNVLERKWLELNDQFYMASHTLKRKRDELDKHPEEKKRKRLKREEDLKETRSKEMVEPLAKGNVHKTYTFKHTWFEGATLDLFFTDSACTTVTRKIITDARDNSVKTFVYDDARPWLPRL